MQTFHRLQSPVRDKLMKPCSIVYCENCRKVRAKTATLSFELEGDVMRTVKEALQRGRQSILRRLKPGKDPVLSS